jgi:xylulokinase
MEKLILSVDLGTTSIKIALVNEYGKLVGKALREYTLSMPDILSVECGADVYWDAFTAGLRELRECRAFVTGDIAALGISAQGETLFFLDGDMKPLRDAIVWMDNRAGEEAQALRKAFGNDACYPHTGQVQFDPCWPAAKVLWVKNHEPEIFARTRKIALIEDWFIHKLTGHLVSEGSLLCSTVYWDITTKKWWPEMLEFLGINEGMLPEIVEPGELVSVILPEVARELGLPSGMVVCTGCLDQAAGAIGAGNIQEGILSENIGAALAICAPMTTLRFDPKRGMPVHYFATPDTYMYHTFTTGGMVLRWFRDTFCDNEAILAKHLGADAYDLIGTEVSRVAPGSDGLIGLPHLGGSMAPDVNADAKGVFFGFTLRHTRAHFARAIMESIGYIIMRNIETLENLGLHFDEVRSLGGGAKSPVWNQIKADVCGKRFVTVQGDEAACIGAAVLAGKAVGLFDSVLQAGESMVERKAVYEPNMENHKIYQEGYRKYKKLFEDLGGMFKA